jgi:small subunit ribosomal protein S10
MPQSAFLPRFARPDTRTHWWRTLHESERLLDILEPSPKTVDSLQRIELPAGVDIEIKIQQV